MDGDGPREWVERFWSRRRSDRRYETIRLVRVYAEPERWEVRRTGPDPAVIERPNRTSALAAVAVIVGDAWVETPLRRPVPSQRGSGRLADHPASAG